MRHQQVIVISALMAVPFGIAIYQDSKRDDADRLKEMLDGIDVDGEGYAADVYEARRRAAEDTEWEAEAQAALDEKPAVPRTTDPANVRRLLGREVGTAGGPLSSLSVGAATTVGELEPSVRSWIYDDVAPFAGAELDIKWSRDEVEKIAAIAVSFADDGSAVDAISAAWGQPTSAVGELTVWEGDSVDGIASRAVLTHSEYVERSELVFARSITPEWLFGQPGHRLGFEKKPILGASQAAVLEAYPTAIDEGTTATFELPGFSGGAQAVTNVEVSFDDRSRANDITIRLDLSLRPELKRKVLQILGDKYGERVAEPESYDDELGTPMQVGVTYLSDAMILHFVK